MATKKEHRRSEVRRLRHILNSTTEPLSHLTMRTHRWRYRGGVKRADFFGSSEHAKARYEEDET